MNTYYKQSATLQYLCEKLKKNVLYDEWGNIFNQSWDYYGTTCQGQDCYDPYDAMLCPIDGSSGGSGGAPDEAYEYAATKPWRWHVAHFTGHWHAESWESVTSVVGGLNWCSGPYGPWGRFSGIQHENSYLNNSSSQYSWTQIANTVGYTNCQAQSWTKGKVTHIPTGQWTDEESNATLSFEAW